MDIVLAQPRGFCAGVFRAVDIMDPALEQFGSPIYVFHEIVHNPHVVKDLMQKGAVTIFSADGVATSVVTSPADVDSLTVIDKATLIDDCALARWVKQKGYNTWLGLTRDVYSHRPYGGLGPIWEMVSQTAFHQLRYSLSLLLIVTAIFVTIYALPWPGLFSNHTFGQTSSALSLAIMMVMYFPILRYYRLSPLWCLAVPLIAPLYLAMTWSSAIAHWTGSSKGWRGRRYNISGDAEVQI